MPLMLGPEEAKAYLETLEAPAPHLDMLTAVAFRAAGAALRLGLVEALVPGPLGRDELAGAIDCDPRAVGLLADTLVATGYLVRSGEAYANGPIAERWLRRDAPTTYAPAASLWQHLLFGLWDDLETSVRQGRPAVDFYAWLDARPPVREEFQRMLVGQAEWLADEIVALVPVPAGPSRLLDVGGGHAAHAVAFAERHPGLTATVLDLPGALEAGRESVGAAGLGDRVELRAGDWTAGDLGTGYDVALLFNVVHGNDPEHNEALLRRVAAAVRPGGVVAVLDNVSEVTDESLLPESVADEAFVRVFSLNLFHTQGGRVYSRDEIGGWLTGAGLGAPAWSTLRKMPANHLAVAVRPA